MPKILPAIADRHAVLERSRTQKMARSAHAYVRGNTAKFYEWLGASEAARRVPDGPAIWICGDCHLGNLGPLAAGDGRVEIQIRDLDQAVIGNPAHDLIRLGLSLATAARGSDLPGVTIARMIEAMVEGYAAAMGDPQAGKTGPEPDVVRSVRKRALGRRWRHLARERLEAIEPQIPLGRKFWALADEERRALTTVFDDPAVVRLVLSLDRKDADRSVRLVDAAYWMKGCSSLGLRRYAAVLELKGGKGRSDYAIVDLKEATDPIAPSLPDAAMPSDNAERVATAARALSPHLGARMIPVRMLGRSLFIRELAPQDSSSRSSSSATARRSRPAAISRSSSAGRMPDRWTPRRARGGWGCSKRIAAARSMRRHGCGTAWSRSPARMKPGIWSIVGGMPWPLERPCH